MQWLKGCLESTESYSVIVVDNNSTDKTVSFIKAHYPSIIILEQNENLGFGKANNIGIRYALDNRADAVFLLNQDAYLTAGTLKELIEIQEEKPEFGVLSPIHLNGTGDKLDINFSKHLNQTNTNEFYSDHVLQRALKPVYISPFVNAAGWLISRRCLMTVGGFDPIFFHYGEDDNYCQRVLFHGFKIGVVPNTFLKHDRKNQTLEKITFASEEYYKDFEKNVKVKQANINMPFTVELKNIIKRRKSAWLKSILKLKFKAAKIYQNEYEFYKRISPEIEKSRKKNKTQGSHYI
jgi:GT2 family glycosyltransferase